MSESHLFIKYEGGDADSHQVEMRSLANSLLGFERIISDGLILFGNGRAPKRGERHELSVRAREPIIGSSLIPVNLDVAAGLLPLGWWLLQTGAGHVVTTWMSLVFARLSGQTGEVEMALEAMLKMREIDAQERLAAKRLHLESDRQWQETILKVVDRLSPSAVKAVAPIGPSVNQLKFYEDVKNPISVDLATADAIRSKGDLAVTDLKTISVKVDGFVHHSKKLNIENPEIPGTFISADVRDPAFDQTPNLYTEAAASQSVITVQAKLGYRLGLLERVYILDCSTGLPAG